MIVADTNLIAYLMITGEQTQLARSVLRKDAVWIAPLLWRSEFRSVLALYLRQQHLRLADALEYMREAETLLHAREYQVESTGVLQLAERSGCSAYDCEFVHLAQELAVALVTPDKQVLRLFPETAISLDNFVR